LRKTIFPVNPSRYSEAYGVLQLEACSSDKPILLADESMKKITSLHHFLVALVVFLWNLKLGTDVLQIRRKYGDLHSSLFGPHSGIGIFDRPPGFQFIVPRKCRGFAELDDPDD
jgi:hypothetical protein